MVVLMNDFYKRYCRVCGSNDGICVDLFANEGKRYLVKVQRLLDIEISKTDQLPKNICHMCISFVCDFDKFRNHCNTVQIKLSNLASHLTQNQEEKKVLESTRRPSNDAVSTEKCTSTSETNRSNDVRNNNQNKIVRPANNDLNKRTENDNKEPIMVNLIDDPDPNEPKTEPKLDITKDWTIQTLPTNNTTLYICNKCSEMLLCESAIQSHQCNTATASKVTKVPSSNQLSPPENDESKTKRKRILYGPNID